MPIYTVDVPGRGVDDWMVAAITIPPAAPDSLETLLRRLLPTPVVLALPPKPVPTELERLLQRLLVEVQAPKPASPATSGFTYMETLLQGLLPGILALLTRLGTICRDWATIVCFSCGKAGHGGAGVPN